MRERNSFLLRHSKLKKVLLRFYEDVYFNSSRYIFHDIYRTFSNKKYKKLERFKGRHYNDRCVIVATGPSIRAEDLELLRKNKVKTLSMNSIFLMYDNTNWRPDYYGIQDYDVYRKLYRKDTIVFCKNDIKDFPVSESYLFFLDYLGHGTSGQKKSQKFSVDVTDRVYDGHTITYTMLQLAVYMGFSEIYLYGVDSGITSEGVSHFQDYGIDVEAKEGTVWEGQNASFKYSYEFLKEKGVGVYNITRGGYLEVFPRKDFGEVFN